METIKMEPAGEASLPESAVTAPGWDEVIHNYMNNVRDPELMRAAPANAWTA